MRIFPGETHFRLSGFLGQPTPPPPSKGKLDKINRWQNEEGKMTASWAFRLLASKINCEVTFIILVLRRLHPSVCKKENENKLITCSITTGRLDMYLLSKCCRGDMVGRTTFRTFWVACKS